MDKQNSTLQSNQANDPGLPPAVVATLQSLRLLLLPHPAALRMWERISEDDRQRLGGEFCSAFETWRGAVGMWMELRGVSYTRGVIEVAYEIGSLDIPTRDWLLREIGEPEDDEDRKLDTAIATSALVLLADPRQAFWRGEVIDVDWDDKAASWSFFCELAKLSKFRQAVTYLDIGESATSGALSTRKYRLTHEEGFPRELADLVQTAPGGGYRLGLQPQDIRLFERHGGKLVEFLGQST